MNKRKIFVATNSNMGWDNVRNASLDKEKLIKYLREGEDEESKNLTNNDWLDENSFIIHETCLIE